MAPTSSDVLVLGAGWTSQFLLPQLASHSFTYSCTARSGTPTSNPFTFDPSSRDPIPHRRLPIAKTVLVTFPLVGAESPEIRVSLYAVTHPDAAPRFLALGAETALLALGGCVLNLGGLWGGNRIPRNWAPRIAGTKDALARMKSLRVIPGEDVARTIIAVHTDFTHGERWLLTDTRSYDWWELCLAWGGDQSAWVMELLREQDVLALPRGAAVLGKTLSSVEFWSRLGLSPSRCLTRQFEVVQ